MLINLANVVLILLSFEPLKADLVCKVEDISPVIDPGQLPKLPDVFETRIQATVNYEETIDMLLLYDTFNGRAEFKINKRSSNINNVFYYDENLVYGIIDDDECKAAKINETQSQSFLGFLFNNKTGGIGIKPTNQALHFNNDFPHMLVEKTIMRGIPVNHYRSCQVWPELNNLNYLIDYYFSDPEFSLPTVLNDFKSLPIAAIITSYMGGLNYTNEYNFYDFNPKITNDKELYYQPDGYYCEGEPTLSSSMLPKMPSKFSYVEEVLVNDKHIGYTLEGYYDPDESNAFRFDMIYMGDNSSLHRANAPLKIIHDFNSGVGFVIDKVLGSCSFFSLTEKSAYADAASISNNAYSSALRMKTSNEFIHLADDTWIRAGPTSERGINVDKLVSKRKDFVSPFLSEQPPYWIYEAYIMNIKSSAVGEEGFVSSVPVSIKVTGPKGYPKYVNNFYEIDTPYNMRSRFDTSKCYPVNKKIQFAIRFAYPREFNFSSISKYERQIEKYFYKSLETDLDKRKFSTLRILSPVVSAAQNGFIIYTGITDNPPPIYHFGKNVKTRVTNSQARIAKKVSSAEFCASYCLNSLINKTDSYFECTSFDYCKQASNNDYSCSFYAGNFSLTTEESPDCDHYSKSVMTFDVLPKEDIYRTLENLVISKKFVISISSNTEEADGANRINLIAEDIYLGNLDANKPISSNGDIVYGATSYFQKFKFILYGFDFDVENIKKNKSISINERKGVSIDECCRLCLIESTFSCESLSYEPVSRNCKWSSISENDRKSEGSETGYFKYDNYYSFYIKNSLADYQNYAFQVLTEKEDKELILDLVDDCAYYCTNEKNFTCRSFSFCSAKSGDNIIFKCLMSKSHNHDFVRNPLLNTSYACDYYSRKTIDDFKVVPQTQLSAQPKSKFFNTTVEACAQICSFSDSFVCRSFDFFVDTNDCYLYELSLLDKSYTNVQTILNKQCFHYTRIYLTENGLSQKIEPNKATNIKYGGGTIFGVILCLLIGSILFGMLFAFIYFKLTDRKNLLPVMKFVNPNYASSEES